MSPHIASLTLGYHTQSVHRAKPGRKERKERPARPGAQMPTFNKAMVALIGPFFPG